MTAIAFASLITLLPRDCADLARSFDAISADKALAPQQIAAVALASATARGAGAMVAAIKADGIQHLTADAISTARTAASLITMSSFYHRSVHALDDPTHAAMRAGLHMRAMLTPHAQTMTFSLCAIAVASLHHCKACLNTHEAKARERGATPDHVQSALRIAAVIAAVDAMIRADG